MGKGWPILSLQMHWPYLFKPEGVIQKDINIYKSMLNFRSRSTTNMQVTAVFLVLSTACVNFFQEKHSLTHIMRKTKRLVTDDSTQNIGGPIIIQQGGAYQIMFEHEKVALIKNFDIRTENANLKALVDLK